MYNNYVEHCKEMTVLPFGIEPRGHSWNCPLERHRGSTIGWRGRYGPGSWAFSAVEFWVFWGFGRIGLLPKRTKKTGIRDNCTVKQIPLALWELGRQLILRSNFQKKLWAPSHWTLRDVKKWMTILFIGPMYVKIHSCISCLLRVKQRITPRPHWFHYICSFQEGYCR